MMIKSMSAEIKSGREGHSDKLENPGLFIFFLLFCPEIQIGLEHVRGTTSGPTSGEPNHRGGKKGIRSECLNEWIETCDAFLSSIPVGFKGG
jgi:hypothetical protein